MENEKWKIASALYEVSSYGKIRNYKTKELVNLRFKNKSYVHSPKLILGTRWVHILVAKLFLENTYKIGLTVNHIDGNKQNNYYKNLEWLTLKENIGHAIKNKLIKYSKIDRNKNPYTKSEFLRRSKVQIGSNNPRSIINEDIARLIKIEIKNNIPFKEIALKFKIPKGIVKSISINKTWKHVNI